MKQTDKIRVAVLYGGRSGEHEVSCRSAAKVIEYLDANRFDIVPIGIDKQGNWFLGQDVLAKSLEHFTVPKMVESSNTWFTPEWIGKPVEQQTLKELAQPFSRKGPLFDVVFPVVHGSYCEDGKLQGLLELADIPYVGCNVLASALGMDKDVSKRLVQAAEIEVAPFIVIKHDAWVSNPKRFLDQVMTELGCPLFVKPVNTGSSVGITKVTDQATLRKAIDEAFRFDIKVIVEKALNIYELEVAVLESLEPDHDPIVSVVGEIKPRHEFYSYEAKYLDETGAQLLIPAPISKEATELAQVIAKKIFKILECEGMARVDLFLDKDKAKIYFNEINTIPGFTNISMYPKLMDASGIPYSALLTHLIELALKRHKNKKHLVHSYSG